MALQLIVTKGTIAARTRLVDGARQQFLAGAALAGDQHARVGARDHVRLRQFFLHQRTAGNEIGAPVLIGITKPEILSAFCT